MGLAGPRAKKIEMSEESKAWVESIKEKVLMASSNDKKPNEKKPAEKKSIEKKPTEKKPTEKKPTEKKFGDIGKAGGTKRVFRRA